MLRFIKNIYCFLILISVCSFIGVSGQSVKSAEIEKKIDDLLSRMTLDEKIGQMNQYNGFWQATGPVPQDGDAKSKYDLLKKGMIGSVLNVNGAMNVRKLQEVAVKETRLGIPLIFGMDVIHGQKTIFPIPLAEACSWDLEAIEKSARISATEASAQGINWTFAPMVDITRDARWGRVMEGAGEDPFLGSKIGVARVKGFQGTDLSSNNTIAACAKHFAGYGFAEAGREYNTVDIGTSTLYNIVLPPFKALVENNVQTFMNSFNVINGIPSTANPILQNELLKDKWNFNGFVVSDWSSGAEMVQHGFAKDLKEAAALAVNAGSDMDMESSSYIKHLIELVKNGAVKEITIDNSVRRILRVKYLLGLFDDPFRYCDEKREKETIYNSVHQSTAIDVAKKSIVLLKNEGALLPLSSNRQKIAVIGALANDNNSPLGSWRVCSDNNTAVTVLDGIKKYNKDISYARGVEVYNGLYDFMNEVNINNSDSSEFDEAVALAANSSTVIMVLGEAGFQSGEGRSRTDLGLPGLQQQLLERVYAVNKNIILVLMNGRPLAIPWAAAHIPSILECWQLGTQTGNAIADILFGAYNPSGKLVMSFPRSVGQVPIYYNHYSTGRPDSTKFVFWSHYSDEKNSPLYPFGYGLSYTKYDYSNLKIEPSGPFNVTVKITVTNTGKLAGNEVVQLYIHDKVASVVRPVKELKGFEKIYLNPGQSKEVRFELNRESFGFYNNNGEFIVESGEFEIMVGPNSVELLKIDYLAN